ncbi:Integrin alpha pat [Brachionus plicatilis]|uniref:Integrin alpha pat n=1 Tax=Brachionus plicatilis TaxID=10195 RepID=A0A3M7PRD0_BRAPC|nr:Integrin alpha pat [Brachionus plicatilis]
MHSPVFAKDTYFGYSVAGYKVDSDSWILVGAPLTERERFHGQLTRSREGAVYRCRINTPNSCFMLPFDKKDWSEVRDHYGIYYSENKTDQLLGSTLLVNDDIIMACAPNYKYVTRMLGQDEFRYEPTGTCFTLRDKMRKFEEHSPCRNSLWGHHRQGYCQAGFSAAISKNDSSLFITGPGAWYWQGMEIRHKYPSRSGEGKNDDSYRGYALDIAHFDNDIYEDMVVSSPRANNCKGYIEIFSSNFRLLHKIDGDQIGAYFGSSLIAVDLNNDFATDIVVGSPMFKKDTENYDIGRVDVFIRDKKSNGFVYKRVTLYGLKSRSRFGSAICKLGDINDDGFNAIAAPYDGEDSSGIKRIRDESESEITWLLIKKDHVYSIEMIIKGSDYGLKTFGFSLSGGLDLDGNEYPDLIVGAYKSNSVAYIRTKSVIKTIIITQTNPRVIDFDSEENYCDTNRTQFCVQFEYCVEYFEIAMKLELDIDKFQNKSLIRALFNETKSYNLIRNYTFKSEARTCFSQVVTIKNFQAIYYNSLMRLIVPYSLVRLCCTIS